VSVLAGAEPFSADGGPAGALVLHGFTGSPQSMRPLAQAFAAAGFAVGLPRLPGHGTTVEDMAETGWPEWSDAAQQALDELRGRCDRVVVAGLSMGGALTAWLATRNPGLSGIVLINPAVVPMPEEMSNQLAGLLEQGVQLVPGVGNDIADPDAVELAYDQVPVAAALSMNSALADLGEHLSSVSCPVLLITSAQDHVVPPATADIVRERVSGPVEHAVLDRSYHVATLDYDRDEVQRLAVDFAIKVTQ